MLIGWDKASKEGDYSCKIYGKIKNGELYIKKVKCYKYKPKEVKKVKKSVDYKKLPYFETKVVKVKKEKKVSSKEWESILIKCKFCKKEWVETIKKREKQGNWVNNENLDKIKFPCFCSYRQLNRKHYGEIKSLKVEGKINYSLYDIEKQWNEDWVDCNSSLKNLIKNHDIHILKGKIIIFEEEKPK